MAKQTSRGFALVSSIMITSLLLILAFAMMTLSSTTNRSVDQEAVLLEAQSNARMALMMAIGKLQRYAGNDMRVTAPADIIDESNPPLLGVWKSWEGTNQEQSGNLRGRPKAPEYASKKLEGDESRFVSWLVSGDKETALLSKAKDLVSTSHGGDRVPLLSVGTLGKDSGREVHVVPEIIEGNGAIAWWVSGENQKARIPKPIYSESFTAAEWADLNRSHSVADPEPYILDRILDAPLKGEKSISRNSADIVVKDIEDIPILPSQSFHDLSSSSVGLLTNVATGGWRKDMSLLTEKWDEQPEDGLEFYKLNPTEHLKFNRPVENADYNLEKTMLYHWADYRNGSREFWTKRGPIASWLRIKNYATVYKKMSASGSRMPEMNCQSVYDDQSAARAFPAFHDLRIVPQMARMQVVVSHYSLKGASGKYKPAVMYTPCVTLWNPYNTKIVLNARYEAMPAFTLPLALNHRFSGVGSPSGLAEEYWSVQGQHVASNYTGKSLGVDGLHQLRLAIAGPITLEPGETRIFSPPEGTLQNITEDIRGYNFNLAPGVRLGGGGYYTLDRKLKSLDDKAATELDGSVRVDIDAKFDVPCLSSTRDPKDGFICGTTYQWFLGAGFKGGRSHSWFEVHYLQSDADKLYPPLLNLRGGTLEEFHDEPKPFLSMIMGTRIANYKAVSTKGVVQANPVTDFFASSHNSNRQFYDYYPANNNLLNCPWDFSIISHSAGGDLPESSSNRGYIVTGMTKADGVSRMVAAELPTRPLASLAELSQMQIRGMNPMPPYAANIVGNSDASPILPNDGIVREDNVHRDKQTNEQQDDSYCANQVLFDDWFFSSIAPRPEGFGGTGGLTLADNYKKFLLGEHSLTNRAYFPIGVDQVSSQQDADKLYDKEVEPAESWRTIASRLEVEGMFNVNSTSVKAWRALLGHARNKKVPHMMRDGSVSLSGEEDYAYSRTSVAGDRSAGSAPEIVGEFADSTEFTGYRVFTDGMLDSLAEKIVKQVRLRGPFLSLSEFVNRQLSDDEDLAIGGAIQVALNELTAESSNNPFKVMQDLSVASEGKPSLPDPNKPDDPTATIDHPDSGYLFPKAAEGHNTYGLPGWTRQADILRPLAPILSARDDTFTIRAYGDSRGAGGKVLARAWCEAVVKRSREYVNTKDEADITGVPTEQANVLYGRRFKIVNFKWLNADEI